MVTIPSKNAVTKRSDGWVATTRIPSSNAIEDSAALADLIRERAHELAAHHAFWNYPAVTDLRRTITEMIHVPDEVRDGEYILELQVPHFINDAAPSRPLLYAPL